MLKVPAVFGCGSRTFLSAAMANDVTDVAIAVGSPSRGKGYGASGALKKSEVDSFLNQCRSECLSRTECFGQAVVLEEVALASQLRHGRGPDAGRSSALHFDLSVSDGDLDEAEEAFFPMIALSLIDEFSTSEVRAVDLEPEGLCARGTSPFASGASGCDAGVVGCCGAVALGRGVEACSGCSGGVAPASVLGSYDRQSRPEEPKVQTGVAAVAAAGFAAGRPR